MSSLQLVILLLFSVGQISCQSGNNQGRKIPQWATGLISVVVFLFLVFVIYMGKKLWKRRSTGSMEKPADYDDVAVPNGTFVHHVNGFSEHEHVYDNPTAVYENDIELSTPM
ncbi:proximal tubules-expressed gene protein-like [Mixophyes fleayi]|uniref:proximal tubules-expressed gene protein-like n=1 Tax=Mixophyes fleayi TaxID=3061075 RepID=UPI003F4DC2F1